MAGAFVIGFLMEWPGLARGHMAVTRTALLLSFMVAVAVPTPLRAMQPQLLGWLLAGLVAQPVLQLLWIRIRAAGSIEEQPTPGNAHKGHTSWLPNAACIGLAAATAILVSRLLKLEPTHSGLSLEYYLFSPCEQAHRFVHSGVNKQERCSDSCLAYAWWRRWVHIKHGIGSHCPASFSLRRMLRMLLD